MRMLSPLSGRVAVSLWIMAAAVAWLVINITDARSSHFSHLWPPDHRYWFGVLVAIGGLLIAPACGLRAARTYGLQSYVGRAVLLFSVGLSMWSLGSVAWFWYNTCGEWPSALGCANGVEAPYPSIADAGFLLAAACYAAGLLVMCKPLGLDWREARAQWWIPALIIVVTGYFYLPPVHFGPLVYGRAWLFNSGYTLTQSIFSTLYMVSDVAIMSLALLLLARARLAVGGMLFRPLLLVSASFIVLYFGDMVFDQRDSSGVYFNGDVSDGLYALAQAVLLVAFLVFRREHIQLTQRLAARAASGPAVAEVGA